MPSKKRGKKNRKSEGNKQSSGVTASLVKAGESRSEVVFAHLELVCQDVETTKMAIQELHDLLKGLIAEMRSPEDKLLSLMRYLTEVKNGTKPNPWFASQGIEMARISVAEKILKPFRILFETVLKNIGSVEGFKFFIDFNVLVAPFECEGVTPENPIFIFQNVTLHLSGLCRDLTQGLGLDASQLGCEVDFSKERMSKIFEDNIFLTLFLNENPALTEFKRAFLRCLLSSSPLAEEEGSGQSLIHAFLMTFGAKSKPLGLNDSDLLLSLWGLVLVGWVHEDLDFMDWLFGGLFEGARINGFVMGNGCSDCLRTVSTGWNDVIKNFPAVFSKDFCIEVMSMLNFAGKSTALFCSQERIFPMLEKIIAWLKILPIEDQRVVPGGEDHTPRMAKNSVLFQQIFLCKELAFDRVPLLINFLHRTMEAIDIFRVIHTVLSKSVVAENLNADLFRYFVSCLHDFFCRSFKESENFQKVFMESIASVIVLFHGHYIQQNILERGGLSLEHIQVWSEVIRILFMPNEFLSSVISFSDRSCVFLPIHNAIADGSGFEKFEQNIEFFKSLGSCDVCLNNVFHYCILFHRFELFSELVKFFKRLPEKYLLNSILFQGYNQLKLSPFMLAILLGRDEFIPIFLELNSVFDFVTNFEALKGVMTPQNFSKLEYVTLKNFSKSLNLVPNFRFNWVSSIDWFRLDDNPMLFLSLLESGCSVLNIVKILAAIRFSNAPVPVTVTESMVLSNKAIFDQILAKVVKQIESRHPLGSLTTLDMQIISFLLGHKVRQEVQGQTERKTNNDTVRKLLTDIVSLREELDLIKTENAELKNAVSANEATLLDQREELGAAAQKLKTSERRGATLEKEVKDSQSKIVQLTKEKEALQCAGQKKETENQKSISDLKKEINTLTKTIECLRANLSAAEILRQKNLERIKNLEAEKCKLDAIIIALEAKVNALEATLEKRDRENQASKSTLSTSQGSVAIVPMGLETETFDPKSSLVLTSRVVSEGVVGGVLPVPRSTQRQITTLNAQIKALNAQIKALSQRINALTQENRALASFASETQRVHQRDVAQLLSEKLALEEIIKTLEEQLHRLIRIPLPGGVNLVVQGPLPSQVVQGPLPSQGDEVPLGGNSLSCVFGKMPSRGSYGPTDPGGLVERPAV